MKGKKILLIDDDLQVRRIVMSQLSKAGAVLYEAANGKEGLRHFYSDQPDLVILDILMPEMDGWNTCQHIRLLSDVPIIMLTALGEDRDIIRGLDCGADDFVNKPFNMEVLMAHVRAALRRRELSSTNETPILYDDGYLMVDIGDHRVSVRDIPVQLSPKEFRLLEYLIQHAGRVRTFHQILENVWGWEYQDSVGYIHVYISHLRSKLEEDSKEPRYLHTIHGVGYSFIKQPPG